MTFKEQTAKIEKELLYKKSVAGVRARHKSELYRKAFPERFVEGSCGWYDTKRIGPVRSFVEKIQRMEALEGKHLK